MADRFAVWLNRDIVAARGPEVATFLQGQLSQDVLALADGASAWSWLLSPQGKVDALLRVTRLSGDDWVLDTDGGWGEAMVTRLNRFKLRTKAEFEALPWRTLGLRRHPGVAAPGATSAAPGTEAMSPAPGTEATAAFDWPGLAGLDCFGPDVAVPAGWDVLAAEDYEPLRIRAGVPRMGAELTEKTIPAETGLVGRTVSFTKGCYTGQELVARIDSRGSNVPRYLRLLTAAAAIEAGAELVDGEGKTVGTVTSAARSGDGFVALGYVRRGVELPGPVWADGLEVLVGDLPA